MSIDELIERLEHLKGEGIKNVRILSKHDSEIGYEEIISVVYDFEAWGGAAAVLIPLYL